MSAFPASMGISPPVTKEDLGGYHGVHYRALCLASGRVSGVGTEAGPQLSEP